MLLYYLSPKAQLDVTPFGVVLVRTFPDVKDPARSKTCIGFNSNRELIESRWRSRSKTATEPYVTLRESTAPRRF